MGQRLSFWIFLGAIGLTAFFVLRPSIDINAGDPIDYSRTSIESKSVELADQLGFSMDSLQMLSTRTQHLNYYNILEDSLGDDLPTPYQMNQNGTNLTGWDVTIGSTMKDTDYMAFDRNEVFEKTGRLQILYDDNNKVRRIKTHRDNPNPTFVSGDSLSAIANYLLSDILDYDLSNYTLRNVDVQDSLVSSGEPGFSSRQLGPSNSDADAMVFKFNWVKSNSAASSPEQFQLELKPLIKEIESRQGTSIKYGASVESFQAMDPLEVQELNKSTLSNLSVIFSFASVGFLIFIVFFSGILNINKGHVDWKRALFILITITLGVMGWRAIYFINTFDPFLSETATTIIILNQLLFGAACGLYAALAYIGWEAIARSQKQPQLNLIDAIWNKKFYFRETGESLIRGYALGGVLLGIFALTLYLLDTVYYQSDSQFGFAEASIQPKLLTINMSAWVNVWLVALAHVGVTIGLLQDNLKNKWQVYLAGVLLIGFLFAGSASLVGIKGPIWLDLIVFTLMAPVIIYGFEKAGLFTFSTGWWMFTVIILFTPYLGAESIDVAYITWIQGFIVIAPLVFGFIAYRYGGTVAEVSGFIPEYQERIANHLRVEKEIEIARDSQFKLMPLQPPSIEGLDVYGFFMPSFEVGGDYFDYVVTRNGSAEPEALTMTIVDVSGKAMKAAMHAVFTSGLLLSRLHRDRPEAILREVTPTLFTRTDPQTFITCIIAQYNLKSRNLSIANAGHCLPIIKRSGKAEFVKTPEPRYPLGLRNEVAYNALEMKLEKGDFVLLYSDGLPEAVDPEGNRFGFDELIEFVESLDTDEKPSNEIALDIKRRVQKFSDYQLADDTTIICLKV
ncbi:MAG: PP2C family protein-serine/threonine phosphatase [Candidatus Halalkalibacterium sp. M3_1C_030]